MSPNNRPVIGLVPSFPRVSGDEPVNVGCALSDMGFSPRERG